MEVYRHLDTPKAFFFRPKRVDCRLLGETPDPKTTGEKILRAPRREGKMRGLTKPESALIIISQNVREEFHLTLRQGNSGKFVDLRTYIRDQGRGKSSPTGNGITIHLELWPQFIAALRSPKTWTDPLPLWGRQKTRDFGRGRFIFPPEIIQKNSQEQIFLEHKNFQGILFIFLRTLARSSKGRGLSPVTIGPLLWSQFMRGLKKIEEVLLDLGWLARENGGNKSGLKLPFPRKEVLQRQASSKEYSDYMLRSF
jgi:Transcriptional Coactivator p15 (PC4)